MASRLIEKGFNKDYKIHAVDGRFVPQQTTAQALSEFGLDRDAIILALE